MADSLTVKINRQPPRLSTLARQTEIPSMMRGKTDSHTALSIVTDDFKVCVRHVPGTDYRRCAIGYPARSNLVQSALRRSPWAVWTMAPIWLSATPKLPSRSTKLGMLF